MSSHVCARWLCAALVLLFANPAHAGPLTIDLPTAVSRARDRAPDAIAALARIAEAQAHRVGAGVRFTQNTEVQVGFGLRYGEPRTLAVQGQAIQPLEPGRRGARIRVADAGVEHAKAASDAELRKLELEVTNVFLEARFADLVVELARRTEDIAKRTLEAAERRRKAGDITDLDVDLVKIALGRVRSGVAAALAERATAIGRLGALIGASPDDTITLAGDLRPAPLTIDTLRAGVPMRADVRAVVAESRVAKAEGALAIANGRPELGLLLGYQLDETDSIYLAGLTVTLPFFNRAQGEKAAARAKLRRAELERAALVTAASRQIVDAYDAYTKMRDAVAIFERDVLPAVTDTEKLLDRSLETGQVAINAYLVARHEILASQREYLERQLQLAKAAASARFIAGVTP
jgi:outer membrane protein, heavy metal efflux system